MDADDLKNVIAKVKKYLKPRGKPEQILRKILNDYFFGALEKYVDQAQKGLELAREGLKKRFPDNFETAS